MTLNPWRLRLLSQLDTYGTVRAVAQAANLSASTVSQQLAVLEAETHTQLLERTGRRVRLTPTGLILARRARAILDHMAAVEAELRGLGEEPAGWCGWARSRARCTRWRCPPCGGSPTRTRTWRSRCSNWSRTRACPRCAAARWT